MGENGDQDDRVRLGHVGGADGGKSSPPHPLPPAPRGDLRPTKPVLSSQRKKARGGGFFLTRLSLPSLQFGELSSVSEDICSSFTYSPPSICSPEAPTHSISLHRRASPPPSCRPSLCFPPARPGTGLQASPEPGFGVPHCPYKEVASREPRTLSPSPYPDPPHLEEAVLVVVLLEHG